MPSLPIPSGSPVVGGDLPVATADDVMSAAPTLIRSDDPRPVRDAIMSALAQIAIGMQQRSAQAAGLSDILFGTGAYLRAACADVGVNAQDGEEDEALRARALTSPQVVTPEAIIAAAASLLAPFTTVQPRYLEAFGDRLVLRKVGAGANPALYPRAYLYRRGSAPLSPDYPDRYYPSDASLNGGFFVANREPGASRLFFDRLGRFFILRVPDVSSNAGRIAPVYVAGKATGGFFVGTGASVTNARFLRRNATSVQVLYQQIVDTVNRIKGGSIRFAMFVDPYLTT